MCFDNVSQPIIKEFIKCKAIKNAQPEPRMKNALPLCCLLRHKTIKIQKHINKYAKMTCVFTKKNTPVLYAYSFCVAIPVYHQVSIMSTINKSFRNFKLKFKHFLFGKLGIYHIAIMLQIVYNNISQ